VASHGYYHRLCTAESRQDLRFDLNDSKKILEDIIGAPVYGYRAPSFSISNDILNIIADSGYLYDSSFNSFGIHGRYGHVNLSQNGKKGIAAKVSDTFYELPISNMRLGNCILPWGGGGYFRLIPFPLFKLGVKNILQKEEAYLLYLHPWEFDPNQPIVNNASTVYNFRHYVNLDKTETKLMKLIEGFNHCQFITCSNYLEMNVKTP